jgi:hypothetical protein
MCNYTCDKHIHNLTDCDKDDVEPIITSNKLNIQHNNDHITYDAKFNRNNYHNEYHNEYNAGSPKKNFPWLISCPTLLWQSCMADCILHHTTMPVMHDRLYHQQLWLKICGDWENATDHLCIQRRWVQPCIKGEKNMLPGLMDTNPQTNSSHLNTFASLFLLSSSSNPDDMELPGTLADKQIWKEKTIMSFPLQWTAKLINIQPVNICRNWISNIVYPTKGIKTGKQEDAKKNHYTQWILYRKK